MCDARRTRRTVLGMSKVFPTVLLAALCFILFLPGGASGSYIYQSLLTQAKKECSNKKCKPAVRAQSKLRSLMKGPSGLYGFRLPAKMLPSQSGITLWSKRLQTSPGAGSTSFVLYSSRSHPANRKIAVSGTVSLPPGKPPQGGWPLISWAHGTTGLADGCAPSKGVDGSYGGATPLIEHWLGNGYAVAATDYEGLGTPGVHPYLHGISAGRSILDILPAAKKIGSVNLQKVFLAGHSQGGHATLFASHLARSKKSIGHKGSVVYAPPSRLDTQAQLISTQPANAYGISALAASILRGAVAAYPNIQPESILQPEALELYPRTEKVCLDKLSEEFAAADLGPDKLLLPGWDNTADGQRFEVALQEMHPSLPLQGNTLLLQGMQDTTVLPLFTNALFSDLQSLNPGAIEYKRWSNKDEAGDGTPDDGADFLSQTASDHSGILSDSLTFVDSWLAGR